jgi:DNA-binding winged helix-turn-helix (wHTH) protein/TolB-like protein
MTRKEMTTGRYRFGLFEFDAARLELRRDGVLVRMQAQPAQVLACLIGRADQVVSREDLRRAVWGDKTFVDFEAGLNFCISQLRSTLQDDSAQPVYIRTVPKSGYQFIAPLQRVPGAGPEPPREMGNTVRVEPALRARPETGSGSWGRRAIAVTGMLMALGVAALFGYRLRQISSEDRSAILAVARFDNETSDPSITKFSDGLTDSVVEGLLRAIATSLHAGYVVLGQVQANGAQVRILAHLIRLSDQTHIWVVRVDRPMTDPLRLEAEVAEKIATEFSARMAANPAEAASFSRAKH